MSTLFLNSYFGRFAFFRERVSSLPASRIPLFSTLRPNVDRRSPLYVDFPFFTPVQSPYIFFPFALTVNMCLMGRFLTSPLIKLFEQLAIAN